MVDSVYVRFFPIFVDIKENAPILQHVKDLNLLNVSPYMIMLNSKSVDVRYLENPRFSNHYHMLILESKLEWNQIQPVLHGHERYIAAIRFNEVQSEGTTQQLITSCTNLIQIRLEKESAEQVIKFLPNAADKKIAVYIYQDGSLLRDRP